MLVGWWVLGDAVAGQAEAELGGSVASAGDVNGDGYDDVLVGAVGWDGATDDVGAAFLHLGSAAGVSPVASWGAVGPHAGAGFGVSVASAGDVNGDGFDDVIIGADAYTNGQSGEGGAFLYLGSPIGLLPWPAWSAEGGQGAAHLGRSVASAGDVNGDGFDDVIVGAPDHDGAAVDGGRVQLWLGSPLGLSAAPAWQVRGTEPGERLGGAVASAGDVDRDGFAEVVAGARQHGGDEAGRVSVWRGSAAGLPMAPWWTADGGEERAYFGSSVASAGDVDGDGHADLVVGADGVDHDGEINAGAAYVFLGSATGLAARPAWTGYGDDTPAGYGRSVASAGDVNGDGYDDLVVGSDQRGSVHDGAAFLYTGSTRGLQLAPLTVVAGEQGGALLGASVASAGDVDGDGFADVVVGAPSYDGSAGIDEGVFFTYQGLALPDQDGDQVYGPQDVCPGAADPSQLDTDGDGLGNACDDPSLALSGPVIAGDRITLVASGVRPGERVEFHAAIGAGGVGPCPPALGGLCLDLGAGTSVGAARADATGAAALAMTVPALVQPNGVYVVQASVARGAGGTASVKSPVVVVDGGASDWDGDGLLDATEASIGTDPALDDTDGDGLSDLEEAAPWLDPLSADTDGDGIGDDVDLCLAGDDGLDGDGDGVADACDVCPLSADAGQADADADGLGDACEGAVAVELGFRETDVTNGDFGRSVASAGDVDGDGFDDVLVGSPGASGGDGRALLYRGSAAGPAAAPSWEVAGAPDAELGSVVAPAGDVNGDGFDDVVVGARSYGGAFPREGAVFVYHGSAAGLAPAPSWTVEGGEPGGWLGSAVASGDVNGDGFDDLVVSLEGVEDDGRSAPGEVRVYLGSAAGLSTRAAWSVEGTETFEGFGRAVAAADVNGDGVDDLVVGAPNADEGGLGDAGRADVYLGSAAGLAPSPAWTFHGDEPSRHFGRTIASAGDVNGDGMEDVAFGIDHDDGTLGEGVAFVFHGSELGLEAEPAWTAEGDQVVARFGWSVAGAGDVDGDGYGDLLVGATRYSDAEVYEGAAFLYLGSAAGLASESAWVGGSDQRATDVDLYCACLTNYADYGASVAGAGDVDGDGLADFVVAAPEYDGGQEDEGRVWFLGGAAP